MDQLLERGMVTAPRETETPMIPASRRAKIIIQKIHLLKVQRDIGKSGVKGPRVQKFYAVFS
jgi:hypothetical protein